MPQPSRSPASRSAARRQETVRRGQLCTDRAVAHRSGPGYAYSPGHAYSAGIWTAYDSTAPPPIEPAGADGVELGCSVAIGLGEEVSVVVVGESHTRMAGSSRDLEGLWVPKTS